MFLHVLFQFYLKEEFLIAFLALNCLLCHGVRLDMSKVMSSVLLRENYSTNMTSVAFIDRMRDHVMLLEGLVRCK